MTWIAPHVRACMMEYITNTLAIAHCEGRVQLKALSGSFADHAAGEANEHQYNAFCEWWLTPTVITGEVDAIVIEVEYFDLDATVKFLEYEVIFGQRQHADIRLCQWNNR